jgi:hypothetical protein
MRILDRLPISEQGWMVPTPDGELEVKPYQIVVLVSLTAENVVDLPRDAPRIPAIVDTGNNHNFAIRQKQFERWVHLTQPRAGQVRFGDSIVPRYAARLWLHPNREGTVEPSGEPPCMLRLTEGIIVYPHDVPNPARLPLLGLRVIIRNGLTLILDGPHSELTIESTSP